MAKQEASVKLSDEELRGLLRVIEIDEGFIESLEKLVDSQRAWLFDAAMGKPKQLSEEERGHAAYIFGRLSSPAEIHKVEALARADSWIVRGNAIEAIGRMSGQEAGDLLVKLVDDPSRPPVERLHILRSLRSMIDDRTVEQLQQLDLARQPDELQYGVSLILEAHRKPRRAPGAP